MGLLMRGAVRFFRDDKRAMTRSFIAFFLTTIPITLGTYKFGAHVDWATRIPMFIGYLIFTILFGGAKYAVFVGLAWITAKINGWKGFRLWLVMNNWIAVIGVIVFVPIAWMFYVMGMNAVEMDPYVWCSTFYMCLVLAVMSSEVLSIKLSSAMVFPLLALFVNGAGIALFHHNGMLIF